MDREENRPSPPSQAGQQAPDEKAREDELSAGEEGIGTAKVRPLKSWYRWMLRIVAVLMTLFQLYTAWFGAYIASTQRAVHLAFALVIAFLLFKPLARTEQTKTPWYDWIIVGLAAFSYGYFGIFGREISQRFAFVTPLTTLQFVVGVIALIVLLEATRRVVGSALLVIVLLLLAHTLFGANLPGGLAHRGFTLDAVIEQMFFTTSGVFGIPLGVSATFIFLFILFGKLLEGTGGGKFFLDLALAAMGRYRGGPAKTAVVGSSLMGSISGSAVANTVTTGTFTIPMMKNTGYGRTFSAAVESVASAGGQIVPPIMGASAFIIASFLGIPYGQVALAAVIPALIYYVSVFAQVDFRAIRQGLHGLGREETPSVWPVLKGGFLYFAPLLVIIYMLVQGFSVMRAGLFAIIASVLVGLILAPRSLLPQNLVRIAEGAGRGIVEVAVATAAAGMVVGLISLTGLDVRFSSIILGLAGGSLLAALILTSISSIILGMGLPTVAAYIVQIPVTIPALIEMGVAPLAAHLFVFYFAAMSAITPPVALAAFAGAAIAGSNPMRTGFVAMRLAIAAYFVPFVFAYSPALLIGEGGVRETITLTLTIVVGIYVLAAAAEGWLLIQAAWYERLILAVSAITLISPGTLTDMIGLAGIAAIFVLQMLRKRWRQDGNPPPGSSPAKQSDNESRS
jgi:TRAP transporter 4TM/12TM fusion protein